MKTGMISVMAMALAASVGHANTIRLDTSPASMASGGEFKATALSGFVGLVGGTASFGGDSFQTFCLEAHEYFRPGQIYNVTLNTGAVSGSRGFDPLDSRTAYLYTMFRSGTLPGYDMSNDAARLNSAGQLQKAIWFLEDETGGENNAFVSLANAAVAPGGIWFGRGLGDVRVMNLSNGEFPYAQDQLTLVGVPLPSAAGAGLLAMAIIAGVRRR